MYIKCCKINTCFEIDLKYIPVSIHKYIVYDNYTRLVFDTSQIHGGGRLAGNLPGGGDGGPEPWHVARAVHELRTQHQ